VNEKDNFFDDLYKGFDIKRVSAKRMINCQSDKRGSITEIVVRNYLKDIEKRWKIDLSSLSNLGKVAKRFDFVAKTDKCIYAIETNFYTGGGSKLNETTRSYKMLAQESKNIKGFAFVWITDGLGWKSAKNNLEETFDSMDYIYNIKELEEGILSKILK